MVNKLVGAFLKPWMEWLKKIVEIRMYQSDEKWTVSKKCFLHKGYTQYELHRSIKLIIRRKVVYSSDAAPFETVVLTKVWCVS